jgi:hypothetical protein
VPVAAKHGWLFPTFVIDANLPATAFTVSAQYKRCCHRRPGKDLGSFCLQVF